jgi:hypothetical protein
MNLFITLLENVNKSRTSANNVSLSFSPLGVFKLRGKKKKKRRTKANNELKKKSIK